MMKHNVEAKIEGNKVIYTKHFEAPVELVFETWTTHEHLSRWWGPDGFTITTKAMDFSENGIWDFVMHGPDGKDFKNRIQYMEIQKPNRIRLRHIGDGDTNQTEDVHMEAVITFQKTQNGETDLTMEQIFPSKEELERVEKEYGAIEGGRQHIGNLGKYIESLV